MVGRFGIVVIMGLFCLSLFAAEPDKWNREGAYVVGYEDGKRVQLIRVDEVVEARGYTTKNGHKCSISYIQRGANARSTSINVSSAEELDHFLGLFLLPLAAR